MQQQEQKLINQSKVLRFLLLKKFDLALLFLVGMLAIYYHFYISEMVVPMWDAAIYLENAQNWLRNEPLEASYRPPLISWIIAGIWSVTGEDWTVAKYVQPIFTISAGVILYQTLKKYKGELFAFAVAALTMLNGYVFFYSTQILTEGLSLFFLVLSIYFLKSEKKFSWILAGIAIGLTFGSRYPIFVLAITLLFVELMVRRQSIKILTNAVIGLVPVILLIIVIVYLKSGGFEVAIARDTELSWILSPFYLEKFIRIFGFIALLLPLTFLFRRTYTDRYNYAFIAWFVGGFLFWSAISGNHQERFMIQLTPPLYFLSILAIESLLKRSNILSICDIRDFVRAALKKAYVFTVKLTSFFPFRYYLCAFVIAFLSLNYIEHLVSAEQQVLQGLFMFLKVTPIYVDGQLYVETLGSPVAIVVPIYAQLIFMIFFPTIAIASRINIKKRIQFLTFGLLCFSSFVMIELIMAYVPLGILSQIRDLTVILATVVVGSLIIELSLWATITIPKPTKIKRILRRNYAKEYISLISILVGSTVFTVYFFLVLLNVSPDSPLIVYAILTISSVVSVSYLFGNLIYVLKRHTKRRNRAKIDRNSYPGEKHNMTISFLIPAYNEELIIRKCIESIDRAAANYNGKTEIVIVNDGSTDNTEKMVCDSIKTLSYANGKIFTISNSGKGFALDYGLKRTSGEIVFRMDADSLIDKEAILPLIEHFKDPLVGSVSGFVLPLEASSIFGKAQNVLFASYLYVKRAQDLFDSIIVQPGTSTAFRKDALLKIGGWTLNQFGEDGEISSRIARFGYKSEFEECSVVYSESPQNLKAFLAQRSRWSIAYYHSRGRNLEQVRELASPRALVFMNNLESHGAGFGLNFAWIILAAAIVTGNTSFFLSDLTPTQTFLATIFIKLTAVHIVITAAQVLLYAYVLKKVHRFRDIKYYPVMRFLNIVLSMWVKISATEAILRWSSKWPKYSDEAFRDLRSYIHNNIDPGTPAGNMKENFPLLIDMPIFNMADGKKMRINESLIR